jgi:nicotinamide mononucleotide adenylyltransferase
MSIGSFKKYLSEERNECYFTFGRMNPPTVGHGKVMDVLARKAGRSPYKIFVSQSQDAKKNPLSYSDKVKHVRKMFPKHGRNVMINKKVRTAIEAAVALYDEGYTNITMVVGADRITEFEVLLNKYNGVKARHGFYNFKNIRVVSAGARDPDSTGIEGMSASKQRQNASSNDFVGFSQGVPKGMSNKDTRKLFNDVRKGMGLKEEKTFKNHISLSPVSERRENYVKGNLFELGDSVILEKTQQVGQVSWLGSNYLVVALQEGGTVRTWLHDVKHQEAQTEAIAGVDHVAVVNRKIDVEKQQDSKKHERMIRRAKLRKAMAAKMKSRQHNSVEER